MNDVERLLIAAHVRQIAKEIQAEQMEMAESLARRSGGMFNSFAWKAEHPVEEFVPQALAQLIDVHRVISATPGMK